MDHKFKVTVCILTKNGMPLIESCLKIVFQQKTPWLFEVLAVDSGSTDGTLDLMQQYPIKVVHILPASFNHGTTRNLGVEHAQGEFVVLLVQDAIPCDEYWLVNLISACDAPNVAGSYSKQLVRPESSLITHYLSISSTPSSDKREVKMLPSGRQLEDYLPTQQFHLALFQDASSCIRKSIWCSHPFSRMPYGEDIEWGKRILNAGYCIIYEPSSAIYHSHDRSPLYVLKRAYADHYLVSKLFGLILYPTLWRALRTTIWTISNACRYAVFHDSTLSEKLSFILTIPIFAVCLVAGQYLGAIICRELPKNGKLKIIDKLMREGV